MSNETPYFDLSIIVFKKRILIAGKGYSSITDGI